MITLSLFEDIILYEKSRILDRDRDVLTLFFSAKYAYGKPRQKLSAAVQKNRKVALDLLQQTIHLVVFKDREPALYAALRYASEEEVLLYLYNTLNALYLVESEKAKAHAISEIVKYVHEPTGFTFDIPLINTLTSPYPWEIALAEIEEPSLLMDKIRAEKKLLSYSSNAVGVYTLLKEGVLVEKKDIAYGKIEL